MPDRIIRESICISDTLNQLSDFEERFWHRLIVNCDDYGRFDARPAILKGRLFPLSDGRTLKDMSNALKKLASVGLVDLYEVDGRPFLCVVTWEKYQRIRAKRSKFPGPPAREHMTSNDDKCPRNPIQSNQNPILCEIRNTEYESEDINSSVVVVLSEYKKKINKNPSDSCQRELAAFVEDMGVECCLKAIDIAQDSNKLSWPYIKGILRNKQAQGIKSLADWDASEQKQQMNAGRPDRNDVPDLRAMEDMARMKRMLEEMNAV